MSRRRTGLGRTEKLSSYGKALSMELKNSKKTRIGPAHSCAATLCLPPLKMRDMLYT